MDNVKMGKCNYCGDIVVYDVENKRIKHRHINYKVLTFEGEITGLRVYELGDNGSVVNEYYVCKDCV